MSDKVSLLMQSLNDFYKDTGYIEKIRPILEQKSDVSLRVLDWFITNYSKKHRIIINKAFDVYQNYKLQLRSYSKKQFDPFCRKNKILFYYKDDQYIETSCGQLCFFRWCFQNGILDFVVNNLESIENDMKLSLKEDADKKSDKKRQPLSSSASRTVSRRHVKYTINFD